MDTTRQLAPTLAPLAFSLSIRSEGVAPAIYNNRVESMHLNTYPVLAGLACAVACACLLQYVLPAWLSMAFAVLPAIPVFKFAKRYFNGEFADERIKANREILLKVVDSPDVGYFADVAESIVKSQYGNRHWVAKAQRVREGGDQYLYLATVMTYAPGLWLASVKRTYDLHLAGAVPSPDGRV